MVSATKAKEKPIANKACSQCGADFTCGMSLNKTACWCQQLPAVMPLESAQDCLCAKCLTKAIKSRMV